jgi:DNA-binding transcriptional MocR family regulator
MDASGIVTFDSVPDGDIINFGIGQPSPDLLPVKLIQEATADFLAKAHPLELNYGERQGDARFRESLAEFLTRHYHSPVAPDSLIVSGGNSQALDFVCSQFTQKGDTIFIEEPTYFLAHRIFADHGLEVVGIPMDSEGMRMDVLREKLQAHRPTLLYTIPSYHNPCACTLSGERRREMAALSREHDFIVVADEVYQLLHYFDNPPPPAMATLLDAGNILSLGSFSKIMAPGLRLGWIQASGHLVERLMNTGVINSGGSFNHFTSQVMRHAIDLGLQQSMVDKLRATYRRRVEAMESALSEHIGDRAQWTRPEGGYFFWLELEPGADAKELKKQAPKQGAGLQPGNVFSCENGFNNFIRLSFAHYRREQIREGVSRLAPLVVQGSRA